MKKDYYPYPKRDPIKNYYPMPNEILHLGLCAGEIAVMNVLMQRENRETYQCVCSYRTIGSAIHMCENTVAKHVRSLEEKGLIRTEPTAINRVSDGAARNGSLRYTILPIQGALDLYHQRQLRKLEETTARYELKKRAEKRGLNITVNEQGA